MNFTRLPRLQYLVGLWVAGIVALVAVTWLCFSLGLNVTTTALAYLLVIVLLSLLDSLITSVILSAVAVGLLNYYFVLPLFTFQVQYLEDISALIVFVVTAIVITTLVRRTRALTDAQRQQAQLLDLTHDTVVTRDLNDVITYWNRGAEELYGWKPAEARGKVARELFKTVFPAPFEEITATVLRTGRWEGELARSRRDGTAITVATRWALQRDEYGKPVGMLETSNDITENKRAEELLRRSQAAYIAEAQKLSLTGSFGWNASTDDLFWSEESFRIFGYDPSTKPSIALKVQRIHPEDKAAVEAVIARAARDKADFDVELRLLMPDGVVKYLRMVARVVTDEPARLQFVGAVMDISAAKRAEEQLHQAQGELAYMTRVTTLGEMTASIAHEVHQPLAAIVTNGEACLRWLERDVPQLDEVSASVNRMIADGKRAGEIIDRIRALIRRSTPQKVPLDINGLIEEVLSLVQREVYSNGVVLRLDLAPGLSQVMGDRVQLQQVILNLVINAIQAMAAINDRPRDLMIRTSLDPSGQTVVAVRDSGPGIPPETASRLFDAFFTTKPNGMGMGLAICRSIVAAHGGRVEVGPANGTPGATFRFSLPPMPKS